MHDLLLVCLSLLSLILLLLVLFLLWQQTRLHVTSMQNQKELFLDLREENQSLRNQLRSPDLGTLAGLNQITLSHSNEVTVPDESLDLGEAINYEEELARKGFQIGDVGYDLEAQGWPSPVIKRGEDPSAY